MHKSAWAANKVLSCNIAYELFLILFQGGGVFNYEHQYLHIRAVTSQSMVSTCINRRLRTPIADDFQRTKVNLLLRNK